MIIICDFCKIEFRRKPSELNSTNFCSRQCYNQYLITKKEKTKLNFINIYKKIGLFKKAVKISKINKDEAKKIYKEYDLYRYDRCKYCGILINKKELKINFINTCNNCIEKAKQDRLDKFKKTCQKKYKVENPFQNKEIKNKIKNINKERYGAENPSQVKEIKEKKKQTTLKNYGVEYPLQNKVILEKVRQTNIKKYGFPVALQNINIFNKMIKRNFEKYNCKHVLQVKEIRNKIYKTNKEKYGCKNAINNVVIRNKILKTRRENYWELFNLKISFKRLEPQFTKKEYINKKNSEILKYKCKSCNKIVSFKETNPQKIYCNCIFRRSVYEDQIIEWLNLIGIKNVVMNKKFFENGVQKYEIDIYLPEYNLGIDFHGLYWHCDLYKKSNYHQEKYLYFTSKNIQFIQIFENEWVTQKEIVKSIIKNKLKLNNIVHSENCELKEILNIEAEKFLNINDLQKNTPSQVNIGLVYNEELYCIGTFKKNKKYWEFLGYCTKTNYLIVNGLNKIIEEFKYKYKPEKLISYINLNYPDDLTYIAAGFTPDKITKPNFYYFKKNSFYLQKDTSFQNFELKNFDSKLTKHENMLNNNYLRIYDSGNLKMIL